FYRVYEETTGAERPWPLSHVPLLIDASEWQMLKAGLAQRAELLEAVLADDYGAARLGPEGRGPGPAIAAHSVVSRRPCPRHRAHSGVLAPSGGGGARGWRASAVLCR